MDKTIDHLVNGLFYRSVPFPSANLVELHSSFHDGFSELLPVMICRIDSVSVDVVGARGHKLGVLFRVYSYTLLTLTLHEKNDR